MDGLREVLTARMGMIGEPPTWLLDAASYWSGWRKPERWEKLLDRWIIELPDPEIVKTRSGWLKKERHLHDWEDHQRRKTEDHRLDTYRKFAADIAERYARVIVTDMDLRTFARKDKAGEAWWKRVTRYQQRAAAPSILRTEIKNACKRRETIYEKHECAYTTIVCNACGSLEEWDAALDLVHTCGACEAVWDQDENAVRNFLALRDREPPRAAPAQVDPSKKRARRNRKGKRWAESHGTVDDAPMAAGARDPSEDESKS
jgi:hypothetical protein